MAKLLSKLRGPYFEFLVLDEGVYREKRGHRIKSEYLHHPDALVMADSIVLNFLTAFADAASEFNYYGDTEYQGEYLERLRLAIAGQRQVIGSCRTLRQLHGHLSPFFLSECQEGIADWQPKWRRIRNEVVELGRLVEKRVEAAKQTNRVLLVLGI